MLEKAWQKNVLSALAIMIGGFVLFNVAFMMAALVNKTTFFLLSLLIRETDSGFEQWFFLWHIFFLVIVLVLSFLILRLPVHDLIKAIYFTMPLAVVITEISVQLYPMQVLVYAVNALVIAGVLAFLILKKKSWLYFYATGFVAVVMLVVGILGIDI